MTIGDVSSSQGRHHDAACWPLRIATRPSSTGPTSSTRTGRRSVTSRSAWARTSASARRWPDWRPTVALSAVTRRFPEARLGGEPVYKPHVTLRGMATSTFRYEPQAVWGGSLRKSRHRGISCPGEDSSGGRRRRRVGILFHRGTSGLLRRDRGGRLRQGPCRAGRRRCRPAIQCRADRRQFRGRGRRTGSPAWHHPCDERRRSPVRPCRSSRGPWPAAPTTSTWR